MRHRAVPAVPVWVARLAVLGDTGRAAPLPEPVTVEGHRLSSLIRVTVTLQFSPVK